MDNINELLKERYELTYERIKEIEKVQDTDETFREYFRKTAKFILTAVGILGKNKDRDIDELRDENKALYSDIIDGNYDTSYANPGYACNMLGDGYGQILSFLYSEIRSIIPYVYETKLDDIVIRLELFVEIYSAFEYAYADTKGAPDINEVKETMYWFVSDYSETQAADRIKCQVDASDNFAVNIVMESDLDNISYLYKYGEYVSAEVEKMALYLNSLPEDKIRLIADTYTEGYRIGFIKGNKDLSKKEVVDIRYMLGFERIVKTAIGNFEKMGLKPTITRASSSIFHKKGVNKIGYFGADANKQYLYDHKDDLALFLDKRLMNRKLEVLKLAYEEVKDKASRYAGPAVIEVYGEAAFNPVIKHEAPNLSDEQQKLMAEYSGLSADIVNRYIKGEERSFTIIAFPVPDIGDKFPEIFDETVKLNTLDYTTYERIQATIIATLNKAGYVEIKGMNGNRTDIRVNLYRLVNPEKETIFENCVADVNIPVGEVFTSPVLEGTNGKLHVRRVFLNGLEYKDIEIDFKDGMVSDYTCSNFDSEEKNKAYIKENVLYNHDTLPMGEFAIGTNTTAYMTAKKYDIASLFPILIAEKTGPHFAVGDTCYARCEDVAVYNEDGKEIVARDNCVSLLRKTDPTKAYFACHTDITIPYDELGSITAYSETGESYEIILGGRFVLEGTQELNMAFDM